MSTVPKSDMVSVQDYLAGEEIARRKHEYVEGVVYAMAGATNAHNRVATNGIVVLGTQLRGKPCQVFNSDTKIRVRTPRGTRFYYPDFSVVCQLNPPRDTFQDSPAVIGEVVSEATRRIDEYEKREAYLSFNTLFTYLIVESATASVVVFRRHDSGFEREAYAGLDAVIPLPEINCQLRLSDLYENVEFPPPADDDEDMD